MSGGSALASEAKNIQEAYGYEPVASYVLALGDLKVADLGESVTLKGLLESLESQLTELTSQES